MKRNRGGVAIALSLAKILILSLPGVTALLLLRPEGGLHGTYSTPNPAGTEVVITSRLDPSIDFPTPHLLQNPFFEHWNFRALGVPATFPPFEVRWTGYLNASEGGLYRFQVDTAGEVRFLLDGRPLTPEPGKETGGVSVILASGWHAVELVYRRGAENPGIRLFWQRPSAALPEVVPRSALEPTQGTVRRRLPRTLGGSGLLAGWIGILWLLWHRRSEPGSLGQMFLRNRHEAALVGIILLALLLRTHQYDLIPFHHETADEYQHGWEGWTLLHEGEPAAWTFYPQQYPPGHVTPFRWYGDSYYLARPYFDHPPGFSLLVGATCTLLGANQMLECTLWRMRVVPIFFSLFTVFLVARAGWFFFPERLAGTLAALLYATLPAIVLGNRLVKAENLLAPLLLAQTLWLEYYLHKGGKNHILKIAAAGAASVWAKATGIAAPLAALLILGKARKGKAQAVVAGVAMGAVALYLVYGAWFGWDLFSRILGLQASKRVALRSLFDLSGISRVVELQLGGGWYLWLGMAAAWMALGRFRSLLAPAAVYLAVMALTVDVRAVFGWYRIPLYPFLCLAGGLFLADWWKEKDLARGFLFGVTALATTLTYSLPRPLEPSRLSVFFLLGVVALGPLWVLFRPSPLATRVRDAGIVAALVIFFAGNLLMVVRQVPIYLQEGIRGKSPAVASTTPSP